MKWSLCALLASSILWMPIVSRAQSRFAKEEPLLRTSQGLIVPSHPDMPPLGNGWSGDYDTTSPNGAVYTFLNDEYGRCRPEMFGGAFDSLGHEYAGCVGTAYYRHLAPFIPVDSGAVYAMLTRYYGVSSFTFIGGSFTSTNQGQLGVSHFAKIDDGPNWLPVGPKGKDGVDGTVLAFASVGDSLFVGGNFTHAGDLEVNHIAIWNLSKGRWEAVVDSNVIGVDGGVAALAAVQSYSGDTVLYVGGGFQSAGRVRANKIAMLRNGKWSALGSGIDDSLGFVTSLLCSEVSFSNGVIVGGHYSHAGGHELHSIARWLPDSGWMALQSDTTNGLGGTVDCFQLSEAGLYAGGDFDTSICHGIKHFAQLPTRYGHGWSAAHGDADGTVYVISSELPRIPEESGEDVYIGGAFSKVGSRTSPFFAEYNDLQGVEAKNAEAMDVALSPNPSMSEAKLHITLTKSAPLFVTFYDALGRVLSRQSFPIAGAGDHEFELHVSEQNADQAVFLMIDAGSSRRTIKVLHR